MIETNRLRSQYLSNSQYVSLVRINQARILKTESNPGFRFNFSCPVFNRSFYWDGHFPSFQRSEGCSRTRLTGWISGFSAPPAVCSRRTSGEILRWPYRALRQLSSDCSGFHQHSATVAIPSFHRVYVKDSSMSPGAQTGNQSIARMRQKQHVYFVTFKDQVDTTDTSREHALPTTTTRFAYCLL